MKEVRRIRKPAVAGNFYPADGQILQSQITKYLSQAKPANHRYKAVIAPHAGYIYSGLIAGSAYRSLGKKPEHVRRVIIAGPSHYEPVNGIALSSAEAFETPLGIVPVDRDTCNMILDMPGVVTWDAAHTREHSLEVQIPFLQMIFSNFSIVPLSVGQAASEWVAGAFDALWGGDETVIVISSDLSHFSPYKTAVQLDLETARQVQELKPIQEGQACGRIPINGLLRAAVSRDMSCELIDLRNSGDTAGPQDRVVGYGAFGFYSKS